MILTPREGASFGNEKGNAKDNDERTKGNGNDKRRNENVRKSVDNDNGRVKGHVTDRADDRANNKGL